MRAETARQVFGLLSAGKCCELDFHYPVGHHLKGAGVLHQSARGFVRISIWSIDCELHRDRSQRNQPRAERMIVARKAVASAAGFASNG